MIEQYLQNIQKICPNLSQTECEFIKKGLSIRTFQPKTFYHKQGDIVKDLGEIITGLFRVYYIDEMGREITFSFHQPKMIMGDYFQIKAGKPNRFFFQCMEESLVICWNIEHLKICLEKIPALAPYYLQMLENSFHRAYDRLWALLSESPQERYVNFLQEYAELKSRISVSDLCSYLGVSRQTLTRLRKKILEKPS